MVNYGLFPPEEVLIKIEYNDPLTPLQVAVFYDGLKDILLQRNVADSKLIITEGSLKTKVITGICSGLASILITAYQSPSNPTEIKSAFNFTNAFNHINFKFIEINNTKVYTSDNISAKQQELATLQEVSQSGVKENTTESIETLQMIITSETRKETVKKKTGSNVKRSQKIEFAAKFDDTRYKELNYEIKIITNQEIFKNIDDIEKYQYYFIADGVLHKSNGKYVKFEIKHLTKLPSRVQEKKNLFSNNL